MKKRFVDFDTYKNIEKNSLTAVERELAEAAELVGSVVNDANLQVFCINEDQVTFLKSDGGLVQANFAVKNDSIVLENLEELAVEENDLENSRKSIVAKMVDNILNEKLDEANTDFSEYFSVPVVKASLREGVINEGKKGKKKKGLPPALKAWMAKHGNPLHKKHGKMSKKDKRKMKKDTLDHKRLKNLGKKAKHKMEEWSVTSRNILEFVDFRSNGNIYQDVRTQRDAKGNVTAIELPRSNARNEGKVIMMHYKDLANVLHCRTEALHENYGSESNWIRAINDMRAFNAMSDNGELLNCFENVVAVWPNLMYLTRSELASKINETLKVSGARNYDDETCEFLADGVLRTAHKTYTDKVSKIYSVAGKSADLDDYDGFSVVAEAVFRSADEAARAEMQVFKDLYRSLSEVHNTAKFMGDEATRTEVGSLIYECEQVLNRSAKPNLETAEDLALYLQTITEAADMDGGTWEVMTPHVSLTGDNPFIHKYATMPGNPGSHTGPFKASPMSDGKSVKVDVEDYYTGMKGENMGMSLSNPYAPKPGDFKMHGEKAIEDDDDLGTRQTDAWPTLKNPYIPANGMTMADSLKLMQGNN